MAKLDESDAWLTISEAVELSGIKEWKLRKLADSGKLASARLPDSKHRRFSRNAVLQLRDQMRGKTSAE